jgi:hypothetical protein
MAGSQSYTTPYKFLSILVECHAMQDAERYIKIFHRVSNKETIDMHLLPNIDEDPGRRVSLQKKFAEEVTVHGSFKGRITEDAVDCFK